MTQKKTPPSFVEGWERIPGASNYEINAEAQARNMLTKKLIASPPDSEGCVQIYGDEKKLEKFNLKEIAAKLFPEKTIEMDEQITLEKEEIVIPSNLIIPEDQITEEIKTIKKPTKMPSKKPTPKKAPSKASTPKKGQTHNKVAKVAEKKPQAHAKAKSGKIEPKSIKEKAAVLKNGIIDENKLKENKAKIDEIMEADTFGHEKIYKLHKLGLTTPEISKTTGKRKEVVQRDIWLYTSGKKKSK